jgi:hypothetical protein
MNKAICDRELDEPTIYALTINESLVHDILL